MGLELTPISSSVAPIAHLAIIRPSKNGRCTQCGSDCAVQERTYTPDLVLVQRLPNEQSRRIYIETKGYFAGTKRNLFKQALKAHPDLDIRLVAGADHWVTKGKTRLSNWAKRFKIKFVVWTGQLPEEWLK